MTQHITVSFGAEREYDLTVHDAEAAALPKDQARAWLSGEFERLECTPSNPMGKILVLDMILNVAKYGGEDRFRQGGEWAKQFAVATGVALGRPTVRVDVANFVVG
jgi:hypothetical protein